MDMTCFAYFHVYIALCKPSLRPGTTLPNLETSWCLYSMTWSWTRQECRLFQRTYPLQRKPLAKWTGKILGLKLQWFQHVTGWEVARTLSFLPLSDHIYRLNCEALRMVSLQLERVWYHLLYFIWNLWCFDWLPRITNHDSMIPS